MIGVLVRMLTKSWLPVYGLLLAVCCGFISEAKAEPAEQPAPVRTRAQRDALSPDQVLQAFKAGNERFVKGEMKSRDLLKEQMATSTGQYPSAMVLSCMDSRAPAEFVFDKGIGEIFNARIAGNVVNADLVGSMEYACAAAGAKLVVVMGHSACGAVGGAIDHVELGSLTGLLDRIHPAIEAVSQSMPGEHTSKNREFAAAVTEMNVVLAVKEIRRLSPILRGLEDKGKIKIVAALYDVSTGRVRFIEVAKEKR